MNTKPPEKPKQPLELKADVKKIRASLRDSRLSRGVKVTQSKLP